jgi:Astacin (Peptidase family M12A)
MQAISDFRNKTCIKFEPYDDTQTAYVVLTDVNATSCVSFVGRIGTKQTVGLQIPGCDKASF